MKQILIEQVIPDEGIPIPIARLAEQMGVTRKTIWEWRRKGDLRTVNIYGRIYVLPKDVAAFRKRAESGELAKHIAPKAPKNRAEASARPALPKRKAA